MLYSTSAYSFMMQESWQNGYRDKDDVGYKWSYYQNELKSDSKSIPLVQI